MARAERYLVTSPAKPVVFLRPERGPVYLAFVLLRAGYVILPILVGLDKFLHLAVDWQQYLSPRLVGVLGVTPQTLLSVVGVVEIAAGLLVAFRPRIGAWVVAAWLWAIIVNLLFLPGYYDIALRDVGLSLGAIALALLARHVEDR
jgi:uncharacterized membrane protein YphA (DoxX/SURF4 family)